MHWCHAAVSIGLGLLCGAAAHAGEKVQVQRFDKADLGRVAAGWKADRTGKGDGSVWKVVADDTGPGKTGCVLAQAAESPNVMFNLCVLQGTRGKNVDVKVAFKAVRGTLDQGGGIVWRYQDADNYYIA